jgi:hypothetical protein
MDRDPLFGSSERDALFRDKLRKALETPAEDDWPVVVAQPLTDPHDEAVIAELAAGTLVDGEPWLVRAVLRRDPKGPPFVARLSVEHFPVDDVEVTGTVLRALPLARIRDLALAWLIPVALAREAMAEVGGWGETPESAQRAREAADEAAKPKPGRRALPREHYAGIAARYLEHLEDGRRNVLVVLAEEEGVPRETVRDWVRKATKLGFLAPGKPGRAEKRPGPNLYRKDDDDHRHP